MNLKKIIMIIVIVTFFSIFYVCLQIETIKVAYKIQHKQKLYKQLVDRNDILRYNINNLVSLDSLEEKILQCRDSYEFPTTLQISSLTISGQKTKKLPASSAKGFFSKIFSLGALAEAKPTK